VGVYQLQGRFALAEPLARQALATLEQVMGPAHLSTALALGKLAGIQQAQWRFRDAELLYQRALAILERLSSDEPAVAEVFNGMIALYEAQGRYAEAAALADRVTQLRNPGVRQLGYGPVVIRQSQSSSPVTTRAR
jgi:tetratricopeptide (TPR) repeat protein